MYWRVKKWPQNYGQYWSNSWITAVVTTRVQVYGGMRFEKNSEKSVYLHGGVKVKWCVHKIHRKVCVGVHRCEVNNDKCITSLADDTRPITTAPALFPNTRTDTTIKTRFTVGTWDRTECTAEAPVAPTIVLHHNPGCRRLHAHWIYGGGGGGSEKKGNWHSCVHPSVYRLFHLQTIIMACISWFNDINLWFRWVPIFTFWKYVLLCVDNMNRIGLLEQNYRT